MCIPPIFASSSAHQLNTFLWIFLGMGPNQHNGILYQSSYFSGLLHRCHSFFTTIFPLVFPPLQFLNQALNNSVFSLQSRLAPKPVFGTLFLCPTLLLPMSPAIHREFMFSALAFLDFYAIK